MDTGHQVGILYGAQVYQCILVPFVVSVPIGKLSIFRQGGDGYPKEARSISFGFDDDRPNDTASLTICLQHLYSSWPDDSVFEDNYLPSVRDKFCSHTRALRCQDLM